MRAALVALGLVTGALLTWLILTRVLPHAAVGGPAAPRVIQVTAPATISAALEEARPGDTVTVAPGVYAESVNLKSGVNLVADPVREATIQGSVTARNVRDLRIEGFQIRGADVGVRVIDSNIVLARLDVSASTIAGVEFSGLSRGSIFASVIHANAGPGIVILDGAAPEVQNNVIAGNGIPRSIAPGMLVRSTQPLRISGNHFEKNTAEALWLPAPSDTIAIGNFFGADRRPKIKVEALQGGSR